jgi:hypothetical protein
LNKSKFELRTPEVQYVGHVISKDGLKVIPEKVRTIQEMPAQTDVAGVKRVLGLVQVDTSGASVGRDSRAARRFHPIQEYRRLCILHPVDPKTYPKGCVFSRFDATHGFWHIQLDNDSSKLLTFNTPFGRFRYCRLQFGISSAPEVFCKRCAFGSLPSPLNTPPVFNQFILCQRFINGTHTYNNT